MAIDYVALAAELTAGHPDTGAYNVDDQLAADELNAKNRTNTALSIQTILKFLILDNVHSTDGTDTQDRSIWQRMKEVVALAETPSAAVSNPWGSTVIGNVTEIRQIKTHQLLDFFTLSAQGDLTVDLSDSNFKVYLAGAQAAGCMSTSQETALLDLNQISRVVELDLGVPTVTVSHVTYARSL